MHAAGESSSDGGPLLGSTCVETAVAASTCVETAVAASPVWSGGSCGIEVLTRLQKRDNEMLRELERANQSAGRSSESQTMGATIDVNLSESKIEVNLSESESDSAWRIAEVAAAARRSRATEDEPPNQYETNFCALASRWMEDVP